MKKKCDAERHNFYIGVYCGIKTPVNDLWIFELVLQQHLLFGVSGWRGEGLVDLVNQLTLECCHSFWFYGSSVSSRIQKGHGATDHWGHLIMLAGHPVDSVGHFQHPPPQLRVQRESDKYVDVASYYHYVHKPLSGIVS